MYPNIRYCGVSSNLKCDTILKRPHSLLKCILEPEVVTSYSLLKCILKPEVVTSLWGYAKIKLWLTAPRRFLLDEDTFRILKRILKRQIEVVTSYSLLERILKP